MEERMVQQNNTVLLKTMAAGCFDRDSHRALQKSRRASKNAAVVHHYRRHELQPLEDCNGVRHWGVSLERAMLTYFQIDPNTRFALHRHDTEQITLVLEGTLYFELDGVATAIDAGEVIAIPARVPHSAFTRDAPVRVVDAWSPIVEEFARTEVKSPDEAELPDYRKAARIRTG